VQTLLVDPFFYTFTIPGLTTSYTHLTGICPRFGIGSTPNSFRLQPRSAADLAP